MFLINNYNINSIYKFNLYNLYRGLGIGDWGLGPIPNPQSPNYVIISTVLNLILNLILYKFCQYKLIN